MSEAIRQVLRSNNVNLQFSVNLVVNAVRGRASGRSIYNVRLDSVASARRIRELFSGYFRRQNPVHCPPALGGVSFRNKVTLETRVRLAIMKQLGERYMVANKGSSYILRGYDSRPQLVINPPKSDTESRPRTFNFITAVRSLPAQFDDESLVPIYRVIGNNLRGKLRSLFIVLDDDDHDRLLDLVRREDSRPRPSGSGATLTSTGVVVGQGSGMEVESGLSLPAPPTVESPMTGSKQDDSTRKTSTTKKSKKRAASPVRRSSDKRSRKSRHRSSSSSSSGSSSGSSTSGTSGTSSDYSRSLSRTRKSVRSKSGKKSKH